MMKCLKHSWVKVSKTPIKTYVDYNGFGVGVFECICSKCGKIKLKKYY